MVITCLEKIDAIVEALHGVLLDYIVILLKAQPSESLSQKLEGAKFKS